MQQLQKPFQTYPASYLLGIQIGEDQSRYLEQRDDERTLRYRAEMVLDKFGDGVEHRRVGGFAEVPIGNGTGDD